MNARMKHLVTGFLAVAASMSIAGEAMAWYCHAQARDGTYGYSYNYPTRWGAANRAIRECQARTYRRCRVIVCRRNG